MGKEITGREYIAKLAADARREMASMAANDANMLGCLAACGIVAVTAVLAVLIFRTYSFNPIQIPGAGPVLLVVFAPGLAVACVAAFITVKRMALSQINRRNEAHLALFTAHYRNVLFDRGLLALVLANDPRMVVPDVAQLLGLPAVKPRSTTESRAELDDRIDLLLNTWGLICRHYRMEPYPEGNPYTGAGAGQIRPRGLPRKALIFALAEGVVGEVTQGLRPEPAVVPRRRDE